MIVACHASGESDIFECAVAFVVQQTIRAETGDEQIGEAVVVVVTGRGAHALHDEIDAGRLGNIGEMPGAVIVI